MKGFQMPHDKNGVELKEGDRVQLIGRVTRITSTGEKDCNVLVVADGPIGEYCPEISCNSKLFEKAVAEKTAGTVRFPPSERDQSHPAA